MTLSLEDKVAQIVWFMSENRAGRMQIDTMALNSYLDDPEVQQWLDGLNKKGHIRNTRFTYDRKKPYDAKP